MVHFLSGRVIVFEYEISTIIEDGIDRMYRRREQVFYYLTVTNEPYAQPARPEGIDEGILKGIYKFRPAERPEGRPRVFFPRRHEHTRPRPT